MTPFQTSLAKESAVVGVKVIFDTSLRLPSGRSVIAHAHFPQFGTEKGTLIFHSFDEYRDAKNELIEQGYSYSEFGSSQDNYFDPDSLREMLSEWGWADKKTEAPAWITHFKSRQSTE